MLQHLDENAIRAAFAQPAHDGTFSGPFRDYLHALARGRPAVILAFPPKAAGTFLRSAAIAATGGQLVRIVHAQGGRDAQPYLPVFLAYFRGALGEAPLVAHVHLQALPANRHFFETLDLRPAIMIRSISDMLASYRDMLDADPIARREGLNCPIPCEYPQWDGERKSDFLIDMMGPWYAGYYATWLDYARSAPGNVCVLRYPEFAARPAEALARVLARSGLGKPEPVCEAAVAEAWRERSAHRFNRGENGHGQRYFSILQLARLGRMLSHYPHLDAHYDALI